MGVHGDFRGSSLDAADSAAGAPGPIQWQFLKLKDGWTWRTLYGNGRCAAVTSARFHDCDDAHRDAMRHGFRPRDHLWEIATDFGITRFQFPRPPSFAPPRETGPLPSRIRF